ncbi:DNA mismatch repair protein MutS [Bacteroidia bacterium]|nr:DNA mismatch repair protein MutS [Bacteroidia bacterium]
MAMKQDSPLMKQYYDIKSQYNDALILFRVGDFYETFGTDAILTSQILGIVLTRRSDTELAGFPYHSIDTYLPKLVKAGHRVAICEQLENPKFTKKLVKRGVTELVTPSVSYNDKILDNKENNFLAGVYVNGDKSGVSFLDISTGEFLVAQGNLDYIDKLLHSFKPTEVIVERNKRKDFTEKFGDRFYVNVFDDWVFSIDFAQEILGRQFAVSSLKGFGIDDMLYATIAAGAALHYLSETAHDRTAHITKIQKIVEDQYVLLDKYTVRNLELIYTPNERAVTLFDVLNQCSSSMGMRMLKRWILLPLVNIDEINKRLNIVEYFYENISLLEKISLSIKSVGDLERLISKVSTGKITPRELVQLKKSLIEIENIVQILSEKNNAEVLSTVENLDKCEEIRNLIDKCLMEDAPVMVNKGNVVKKGYDKELDELKDIAYSGKDYLLKLQQREIEKTGITTLKVAFNNVFGYYIEVSNGQKHRVPSSWVRKQTLTTGERFITEELKEYETKILSAEEKILEIETRIFDELVAQTYKFIVSIQKNSQIIAGLDCLLCLAKIAKENNYVRPILNDSKVIDIKGGRHPVIEKQLPPSEKYISNDVLLNADEQQIMIITGPNMSGKSSLLRQTALIVLMAQIGSFVPVQSAEIGYIDRIFTRVGASDNISSGESTFMVEMNETASILNNISDRSLVLLDEIGRGTSTYDGISIAWAITEFLHEQPDMRPKVMFATHYHELIEMEDILPRIKNYHVSVKEIGNKVLFVRKLAIGGSEHSFGIHVARMAGMPPRVIDRANEVMKWMEEENNASLKIDNSEEQQFSSKPTSLQSVEAKSADTKPYQLSFIQLDDPLLEQIREDILTTNLDTITPIEAMIKLSTIKKRLSGKG